MKAFLNDLRYALRGLARTPTFSAVAIVTLALSIGATAALFSIAYSVLLRPLPFPNADRLVQLNQMVPSDLANTSPTRGGLTVQQLEVLRRQSSTLSFVGYFATVAKTLTGVGRATRLYGKAVSPVLFEATGVRPFVGRAFVAEEERSPGAPTVILSYQTWTRQFASSEVVGKTILLDGTPHLVIGVMPNGFFFPPIGVPYQSPDDLEAFEDAPQFWVPLVLPSAVESDVFSAVSVGTTFALLREGVGIERAVGEVNSLAPVLPDGRRVPIEVTTFRDQIASRAESALLTFQVGVAFLLLIGCANVANLFAVRAAQKQHDLRIRLALGATPTQIARQSVVEAVTLALAGGAMGSLVAYQIVQAARLLPPDILPRAHEIQIDGTMLAFGIGLSLVTGGFVGLFAGMRLIRSSAGALPIKSLSPWIIGRGGKKLPSEVAVAAQVAAAMVLLTGAALFANSFVRLSRFDQGLRPRDVLTFRLMLPRERYGSGIARLTFYDDLALGLEQVPGIRVVAATTQPFNTVASGSGLHVNGVRTDPSSVDYRYVTPDYFRAVGIPVLRGREFTTTDRRPRETTTVAIVNESFARRHFGTLDILGRHIGFDFWPDLEIVGVAGDTRPMVLSVESGRPEIYLPPDTDRGLGIFTGVVLTSGAPITYASAVRDVVERLDPNIAAWELLPLEDVLARGMAAKARVYTYAATVLAGLALLLSAIGLYSVLAYSVRGRIREIGVRMALGATRSAVAMMIIRRGLLLTTCGLAVGIAIAAAGTRTLQTLLFGVTPGDPLTIASAAVLMVSVALVACYLPARRAALLDPITTLRTE